MANPVLTIVLASSQTLTLTPNSQPALAFYNVGLMGPKGNDGAAGAKGDQGNTGPAGPAGLARQFHEMSATGTMAVGDTFIRVTTAGSVITLQPASTSISVQVKNASNGQITIQAQGSDRIEGLVSIPLMKGDARLFSGFAGGFDVC